MHSTSFLSISLAHNSEGNSGNISVVVDETMRRIDEEMAKYERVIVYWNKFGPILEASICSVVRAVLTSAIRQSGLARVKNPQTQVLS